MAKKTNSVYQRLKDLLTANRKIRKERKQEFAKIDRKYDRKIGNNEVKAFNIVATNKKEGDKALERLRRKDPRLFEH